MNIDLHLLPRPRLELHKLLVVSPHYDRVAVLPAVDEPVLNSDNNLQHKTLYLSLGEKKCLHGGVRAIL